MNHLRRNLQFKMMILDLVKQGQSKASIERKYGVSANSIRKWEFLAEKVKCSDKLPVTKSKCKDSVVLAIPDLHAPFEHPDALAFLQCVKQKFHPTAAVCLGDEIDAHAFSRYPMDPDGLSAGQELQKAIEHLTPFYLEFPEMLVCESNHTIRPWKKGFEAGLPAAFLPTYAKILRAPDGWRWAKRHEVDGVLYIHGDNGKGGIYAHQNYVKEAKRSVVIGHMHANAGVQYDGNLFGMNAGCLIDREAYAFKYASSHIKGVNLGCGLIINGEVAHFIPMRVDFHNRWIGRL